MNRPLADDGQHQHDSSLILFVTGEAPRSHRAQRNLAAALDASGISDAPAREIDLLHEPQQAIHFGIFATPALMHIDASGNRRVLYGDLSDEHRLKDFLSVL
ncbi:circadian clock KaiB family protein [Halomonas daqiaonensis]|uniref:Circadian clock protein KaiB n=1 Tax=Halomonas daqiaonensis TaxID=650850 RepID=A0A1H7MTT5_9GAMM|nr:circadian clock KaiB family protein [Halomonas daqiaonensis]SEL14007.1 circadian clock protein KaiB [Halomonas daqiaonensis]